MLKLLVFDLDDTLFPEHDFVRSGFQTVANWLEQKRAIENFFTVAWDFFQKGRRGNIFNLVLEEIGIEFSQETIAELLQIYREHLPDISLYHDANWAINYFQGKTQLGIITDGYLKVQQNKVKALGIANNFDWIIYTDSFGRDFWKPNPIAYLKAMEFARVNGYECVYIGDNPKKDFVTAKQLGWLTIHICRDLGEYVNVEIADNYKADIQIKSLTDLVDVL